MPLSTSASTNVIRCTGSKSNSLRHQDAGNRSAAEDPVAPQALAVYWLRSRTSIIIAVHHHGVAIHGGTVTRNNLRIRAGTGKDLAEPIDHPVQTAAVHPVDIGILDRAVEISRHDHVIVHEPHHGVAVGMGPWYGDQHRRLTIHAELDGLVKSEGRESFLLRGHAGSPVR